MRRVNLLFVAIVVGSMLSGAVSAVGFGTELRTIDTIAFVEDQVRTDVESLSAADGELRVTVRITNPTGYPIRLEGTFVRVFHDGPTQLAYGAGERLDDGPEQLPARGSLMARYAVGLSPEQAAAVRSAFDSGPVRLTVFHAMSLRGESFEVARTNVTVTGEVAG